MTRVIKGLHEINDRQDRIRFARENKAEIIHHKKMMPKNDSLVVKDDESMFITPSYDVKLLGLKDDEVLAVSNAINFFDSHKDVSLINSWNKTVSDKGNRIPQLKDHLASVNGLFAKNIESMIIDLPIRALGYDADGETQTLAYKIRPYEQSDLDKYRDGTYRQHSSGLRYKRIWLGIDDPEDEESYKLYMSQIDNIINAEAVKENGFYFGVEEQEAIENSLVVFASNRLTPAFTNISYQDEPQKSTRKVEPLEDTQTSKFGFLEHVTI